MPPVTVFSDCITVSFGWPVSCRLRRLEICEPLCQLQLRFVSTGDRLGKPVVKCCRVFCRACKDFFVQQSQDRAARRQIRAKQIW